MKMLHSLAAYDCEEPPPPENGLVATGTWTFGIYSRIACINPAEYDFAELPAPFYKCGNEGFWDPPNSTPFRYPGCARKYKKCISKF